jgi:predicted metalloprotease
VTTKAPPPPTRTKTTPPPPPKPSDNDLVTKNRLYKTGAQKTVNCREPGVKPNSVQNARKYYTAILGCLERAWPRQVVAAGGRFRAPKLLVYSGPISSPCSGGTGTGYFYCPVNETIYMDGGTDAKDWVTAGYGPTFTRADSTDTIAHEFGHHVQYMTGILSALDNLRYESDNTKSLELSRRLELQASCFGHTFLSANKRSYPISGALKQNLAFLNSHQGDDYNPLRIRDHGSRFSYARWTKAGDARGVAGCNTFVAPAKYVG